MVFIRGNKFGGPRKMELKRRPIYALKLDGTIGTYVKDKRVSEEEFQKIADRLGNVIYKKMFKW